MDQAEFEAQYGQQDKGSLADLAGFVEEEGGEELLMLQDVLDGITLLSKVKRLLGYIGDVTLCKTLTKRERDTIEKVNDEVSDYLDNVSENYEDSL